MNSKTILRALVVVAVSLIAIISVNSFTSLKRAEVERQAEIQRDQIKAEALVKTTEVEQAAKVERTEERSQFWQKLVPWGQDEAETNDTGTVIEEEIKE